MTAKDLPDQFKKMGPAALRTLMTSGGLNTIFYNEATLWLAEQDQEVDRLMAASQAEQIEIARSAKDAAWEAARAANSANTRATVALIIAAISAITTIIGIVIAIAEHSG
jgi:hypothetical protein